jgi:nuclear GTP-binding protein
MSVTSSSGSLSPEADWARSVFLGDTRRKADPQGGIPDLEGSAVSILRDWNTGKIPYYTIPPAVHASSMPSTSSAAPRIGATGDDVEMTTEVGDAKILNNLSEAFTIDGLFDSLQDEAAWSEEEDGEEVMEEDDVGAAWEAEEAAEVVVPE